MPSDYGYSDDDQMYADDGSGGPAPGGWVGPQAPRLTTLDYRPDRDGPFSGAGGFHASPFALDGASGNLLLGDGSTSPYGPLDASAPDDPHGPGAGAPGFDLRAGADGAPALSDHIDAANALGQILQPAIGDALAAPLGMLTRDEVVDRAADVIGQAAANPALSPDHYRDLVSRSIDALTALPDDEAGLRQGLSQLQGDHSATLDQLNAMAGGAGGSGAGGWDAGAYPSASDFGGPDAAQDDTQAWGSEMDDDYGAASGGEAPTLPVSGAVQRGGPGGGDPRPR